MHILVVADQHPDSLGGAQVAIRTQRAGLVRLGHRVSIAAPALHRRGYQMAEKDRGSYIALPSQPITPDREYALSWPTRRTDRALAKALTALPPVDLVHVQGDFWGAMIGIRAARTLGVPLVFTMHNNVDQGTRAMSRLAPLAFLLLRCWRALALGRVRGSVASGARGAWRYLAELAAEADAVLAPSSHFAAQLETRGVHATVHTVRGGVDDELIASVLGAPKSPRARPLLLWLGRMSHEKRVLEFVAAIALSGVDADVRLYGAGLLLDQVRAQIAAHGLADRVRVMGSVSHGEALAALGDADALVQTSVGFETQGLTSFEAAALGTPTIFCDAAIAADIGVSPAWVVTDESTEALAKTLSEAVRELHAAPGKLRVPEAGGRALLQSAQTQQLLAHYERVLQATNR